MLDNLQKYHVILASNSPRRRELLGGLGIDFEVKVISGIDESYPETLVGEEIPTFISRIKAQPYLETMAENDLVITADTIVYVDGEVLGKPADANDASCMLRKLSGRVHQVITGVTLTTREFQHSFAVTTDVTYVELSDCEIDYYVSHYRPFDKAGAYGVQEWIGFVGVSRLEGSYFNVMGLPVQRLYTELKKL